MLLEFLANEYHLLVSDLKFNLSIKDIEAITLPIHNDFFSVEDWNYALSYIFDEPFSFSSVSEAKEFIIISSQYLH